MGAARDRTGGGARRALRKPAKRSFPVLPLAVLVVVLGLAIALVVYLGNRSAGPDRGVAPAAPAAPDRRVAPTAPAAPPPAAVLVGQSAPPFTLTDAAGKAYSLNPGDGKDHLLVFYMGYF